MSTFKVLMAEEQMEMAYLTAMYIKYRINQHNQNPETASRPFVLGLPTGSTPLPVYKYLVQFHKAGELSFQNVMTFNMDEYYPISPKNPNSYYHFMFENLFKHIDIKQENINLLDGQAENPEVECQRYEALIQKFPVDLFMGGVGMNGHIAFNEPNSSLNSITRMVELSKSTLEQNKKHFNGDTMPQHALTIGLKTLLNSKEIIIITAGINKASIIKQFLEADNYDPKCPITVLKEKYDRPVKLFTDFASVSLVDTKIRAKFRYDYICYDIEGNEIKNELFKYIDKTDKVMITSPHPDDDVLGVGGTMKLLSGSNGLLEPEKQVSIVYMTNGVGGLASTVRGADTLRINEAVNAVGCVGYRPHQVVDGTMPFYRTAERAVSDEDVKAAESLLNKYQPNHIFICCCPDPKRTHIKCMNILENCKMPESVKHIWLYKSAWQGFGHNESNIEVIFDEDTLEQKKKAIMSHESQHQLMVNDGDTTGLQSIIDSYQKSERFPGYYSEKFNVITPEKFHKKTISS